MFSGHLDSSLKLAIYLLKQVSHDALIALTLVRFCNVVGDL